MPTIKDVAKKTGLAVGTVSRVFNNRGYISEETRQKVFKAAEELNYQPNEVARSLCKKKSNLIGLIIPTVAHPFFSELTNFIEFYANELGYKILLCNSELDSRKEKEYIDLLKRSQVDGIIMGSHTLEVDEYVNLDLPLVAIDRCLSGSIPYIASDNYEGGRLATSLLIEKGCKKLVHVCGNLNLNVLANKRNEAFLDVCKCNGIENITVETDINVFDDQQYQKIIQDILMKNPDIDGVFASSDIMAAYAIKVGHEFKRNIPKDIKIVGYDDINLAKITTPKITTIKQPLEEMSKIAVELIHNQVNGNTVLVKNIFPVTLVERGTT